MLEGRFPRQKRDVPGAVVVHLASQVRVSADLYPSYEWSGRTIEYHRAQIREFLGFREATVQDGSISSRGWSSRAAQRAS
jgi:hypothetical protein